MTSVNQDRVNLLLKQKKELTALLKVIEEQVHEQLLNLRIEDEG